MATSSRFTVFSEVSISARETTGALGDSITVLPLLIALAATTSVSLPHVLVGFGLFQIVWGLHYGMPMSIEPMKALVGLAIVGALSYPELAAAGLLAGIVLLVVGRFGLIGRLERVVGEPVIRGVQLAVALLLLEVAVDLSLANRPVAVGAVVVVAILAVLGRRNLGPLILLGIGGIVAVAVAGLPEPSLPELTAFPAGTPAFSGAALEATVAQLGMTIGNAAIATALLCGDLYGRNVSSDDLSSSMGATCLAAVPFGGIPMCHGSGGLAGKYAFGAETAGANLILGLGYLALALVATGALLAAFPAAVLGILLFIVSFELARAAFTPVGRGWPLATVLAVGLLGALVNIGLAFVAGLLAWLVYSRVRGTELGAFTD